jgi:hypothetical protein
LIKLPTFHSGQVSIYNGRTQYNAVCCGRRWGKTKQLVALAADTAAKGRKCGIFTPEYKQLLEPYDEIRQILMPITQRASKTEGTIRTINGGVVDFWPLNDNDLAGRGREYHRALIDEAAFTKPGQMMDIWNRSIKPTLLTTRGDAWSFSTPNGIDPDNFFYRIWNEPAFGWKAFHAPTSSNPYVPQDELEKERKSAHPLVWKQEFLAEFVSWDSESFFRLDYFLKDGKPVEFPAKCDGVFAIMDCAVKSGSNNDATAILYCSVSQYHGQHLIWLDYEMHSIDAASLEYLAPKVLARCEELAVQCKARNGSLGLLVEDAAGGQVLIQQGAARGWPVKGIDSKITARGKDERAMLAGGPAYSGDIKISQYAFDKTVEWRGRTLNHLIQQVTTFRIGDKEAYKRADDLLDCAAYSIIVACADRRTF